MSLDLTVYDANATWRMYDCHFYSSIKFSFPLGIFHVSIKKFTGHSMCNFSLPWTLQAFIYSFPFFDVDILSKLPYTILLMLVMSWRPMPLFEMWHKATKYPIHVFFVNKENVSPSIVLKIMVSISFLNSMSSANLALFFVFLHHPHSLPLFLLYCFLFFSIDNNFWPFDIQNTACKTTFFMNIVFIIFSVLFFSFLFFFLFHFQDIFGELTYDSAFYTYCICLYIVFFRIPILFIGANLFTSMSQTTLQFPLGNYKLEHSLLV